MHFVLVDFNNIFFRAYFLGEKLYTSKKYPIGAACACIPYLNSLMRTLAPTHIALLRDMGRNTWRHKMYPAYKQNRAKTEPELSAQFCLGPLIAEYMKLPMLGLSEFEADDCIATLAIHAQKFANITIVTTDKDLLQLLNDKIRIYNPSTKTFHYADHIKEKYQIQPHQIQDYLSLIGDSADNLPGITGIGPKTAVDMLAMCKTTEDIFKNIPHYKKSTQEKLRNGREQFDLMKLLISLSENIEELIVKTEADMAQYKYQFGNSVAIDKVKAFFEERLVDYIYTPPVVATNTDIDTAGDNATETNIDVNACAV